MTGQVLAQRRDRPDSHFAAARRGAGLAGDQGIDPPPGGGGVRGVHPDSAVRRLVSRSRQHRSRAAVSRLRADGHELSGAVVGAVSQFAEPAGRHQEPHAAHDRDQAGAGERSGVGPDRGLHRRGHLPAGGDGRDQLRVRRARAGPYPRTRRPTICSRSKAPCRAARPGSRATPAVVHQHRHKVFIDSSGHGHVEMEQGHTHSLDGAKSTATRSTYQIGPAEGMLMARVPVYGKLAFRDRTGKPADKGHQRGRRMDLPQLHRGRDPGRGRVDLPGDHPEDSFPTACPSK